MERQLRITFNQPNNFKESNIVLVSCSLDGHGVVADGFNKFIFQGHMNTADLHESITFLSIEVPLKFGPSKVDNTPKVPSQEPFEWNEAVALLSALHISMGKEALDGRHGVITLVWIMAQTMKKTFNLMKSADHMCIYETTVEVN